MALSGVLTNLIGFINTYAGPIALQNMGNNYICELLILLHSENSLGPQDGKLNPIYLPLLLFRRRLRCLGRRRGCLLVVLRCRDSGVSSLPLHFRESALRGDSYTCLLTTFPSFLLTCPSSRRTLEELDEIYNSNYPPFYSRKKRNVAVAQDGKIVGVIREDDDSA